METADRKDVLFIATCALGGGDVAFASNLLARLVRTFCVAVAVSAQAGREPDEAASAILQACPAAFSAVAAFRLYDRRSGRLVAPAHTGLRQLAAEAFAPVAIVQGPLRLFDDGHAACAALGFTTTTTPHLITVREAGQGWFCAPPTPGHTDASSGLAPGELGLFELPLAAAPSPSPQQAHVVGYFRTPAHGAAFGALVAAAAVLGAFAASGPGVCYAPADAATGAAVAAGAAAHPGVRAVEAQPAGSLVLHLVVGGPPVVLEVRDVLALRAPLADFRALLAGAEAAVVTGDGTLTEAL